MKTYSDLFQDNDLKMWIDLSTYCNAACPQCHRTNPDGLGKAKWLPLIQWSLEDFKKIYPPHLISKVRAFDICGTWGDPVMCKDIAEICYYIIENSKATIAIFTNGSFRNADWWWMLGAKCKDRLVVTFDVDGSTQEIHQLYRQKTNLKLILENMEALSDTPAFIRVFTVIFKHNQHDLYNIAKLVKDNGAYSIYYVASNRFHRKGISTFPFTVNGQEQELVKSEYDDYNKLFWSDIWLGNKGDDMPLQKIKSAIESLNATKQ